MPNARTSCSRCFWEKLNIREHLDVIIFVILGLLYAIAMAIWLFRI